MSQNNQFTEELNKTRPKTQPYPLTCEIECEIIANVNAIGKTQQILQPKIFTTCQKGN